MHLIVENNQNMNNEELILFDSLFCSMLKLSSTVFVEKWKLVPKKFEVRFSLGKIFTNRESSIIKRLQVYNIMICSFKSSGSQTDLYVCCTTRDNSLILAEIKLSNCDVMTGEVRYKSERLSKETELELFLQMILSQNVEEDEEQLICR